MNYTKYISLSFTVVVLLIFSSACDNEEFFELERPVEYLVALDEGHGFRKENNILAMTAAIERFFANHLDGRYQDEISPDLQTQLETLTVDIETVQ